MSDYFLLYGEFFYCKSCDFEFNKLGQKGFEMNGSCPSCGNYDIEYLPTSYIEASIKRFKEELEGL